MRPRRRSRLALHSLLSCLLATLLLGLLLPARAVLAAGQPEAVLDVPASGMLGEAFTFTVGFDNNDAGTEGYGPYLDLVLPAGVDGAVATPYDGINFVKATYLGSVVQPVGGAIRCNGTSYKHPLTEKTRPCAPGELIVVLQPPYGSFTPTQPRADITINAFLSNLADLGTPLTIKATPGFFLGNDPLDNPTTDVPVLGTTVTATYAPELYRFKKMYIGPEDETATGPNFARQYRVEVDIADGQRLNNLRLSDQLDNTMQFLSVDAVTTTVATSVLSITTPFTTTPGGTLTRELTATQGTTGTLDAAMLFSFFVPRLDAASADVLNPITGDDRLRPNNANMTASWTPIDTRDATQAQSANPAGPEHQLEEQSIAIQKSVRNVVSSDLLYTPDDVVEYTLDVQVSDFFAFDGVVLTDTLSDGQRFAGNVAPTLEVVNNPVARNLPSGAMDAANFTVDTSPIGNDTNPATDGTTIISFRVSDEMLRRLGTGNAANGRLIGGCVAPDGSGLTLPCDQNNGRDGATTLRIVFRAVIQDNFSDTYPSGDQSVDQGDVLTNTALVDGLVLANVGLARNGNHEADDTTARLMIERGSLSKSIYAINGSTNCPPTNNCDAAKLAPGDRVTYRLRLELPSSDIENLTLTDYLPLPVLDVDDVAPYLSSVTSFSTVADATVPAAGSAKYGPTDTFHTLYANPPFVAAGTPSLDSVANSVVFDYGDFDDPQNRSSVIDILFTVTANNKPFADQLLLTNQVRAAETSTNSGDSFRDAIVQIELNEPRLNLRKGIIATNSLTPTFTPASRFPAGVNYDSTAACGSRFSGGVVASTNLAGAFNSNLSGADANDRVTYAIVVENTGSGPDGAFDVVISDTLPTELAFVPGSLCVTDGTGAVMGYSDLGGGLWGSGIQLDDPGPTNPGLGAIDQGVNRVNLAQSTTGRNIAIVTYDAIIGTTVTPSQSLRNTAKIRSYTSGEGGASFTPLHTQFSEYGQLQDTAQVTVLAPTPTKSVSASSEPSTSDVPAPPKVTIGEIVRYRLAVQIPEGTATNVQLRDQLPLGLTFVDDNMATVAFVATSSPGITSTLLSGAGLNSSGNSTAVTPTLVLPDASVSRSASTDDDAYATGDDVFFKLGNLVNLDNDADAEYVVIEFNALVDNSVLGSNDSGDALINNVLLTVNGAQVGSVSGGAQVTVAEPSIPFNASTKTVGPPSGDAGDAVAYTVSFTNTGTADAFDARLLDTLPANLTLDVASINVTSVGNCATNLTTANSAGNTVDLRADRIPVGCRLTLTYSAQLKTTVTPGQLVTNTAAINYTSLPGTNGTPKTDTTNNPTGSENSGTPGAVTGERTGGGTAPNDYAASDTAGVTIFAPAPAKTIVATSETDTTGANLTIGEIARYRVVTRIAEGTSPAFQLRDNLPPGLRFLNDGTIKIALVSNDPGLSSSTIAAGAQVVGDETTVAGVTPSFVLPAGAITNANGTTFGSGDDPIFSLGNLTNTDSDLNEELVVIEFNALLDNSATGSNDRGETRDNTITVRVNNADIVTSNAARITVVEPQLAIAKLAAITPPVKAGDTITYTIALTNSNAADAAVAYDSRLTDTLDTNLQLLGVSVAAKPAYATVTDASAAPTVDLLINRLNPGDSVQVQITARVLAVNPSTTIPNSARVTYTSLAGTNGTTTNPTGSANTATSGDTYGERTGSGTPLANDHNATGSTTTALGSIGDYVWFDADGDGVQDAGELPLAGVTVQLTLPGGASVTTTTNASGAYNFQGLPAGGYVVTVDPASLPAGLRTPTFDRDGIATASTTSVALAAGQIVSDADWGYRGAGSVGDFVWFDQNGDGVANAGEKGFSGIPITLVWAGLDNNLATASDNFTYTQATNATGGYNFTGLPQGSYRVDVAAGSLPTGLTPTYDLDGTATASTATLALGNNENNSTVDFGYTGVGSLGDTVWYDRDNDGMQDAGEPGLAGVGVTLRWAGQNGTLGDADDVVITTTTSASGVYTFPNLPHGPYRVTVDGASLPAGLTQTYDLDGLASASQATTSLSAGTPSRTDVDFGYTGAGAIGDYVWYDADGDGQQEVGEPGLGGVTVTLTWYGKNNALGGGDDLTFTTTTNAAGSYGFTNLPDGGYEVAVTGGLPTGLSTPTADTHAGDTTENGRTSLSLNNGATISDVDFGYRGTGSLGNYVWLDRDGDQAQDNDEPGLAGVTITLIWFGSNNTLGGGDDVTLTTTTDANGGYSFTNLPAGQFRVAVDATTLPDPALTATIDAEGAANGVATVALTTGQNRDDVDFGYQGSATFGDRVWYDADGDGVQDAGEPGLPNITVRVVWAGPDGDIGTTGDNVTFVAQTDANGIYGVSGLPAGTYRALVDTADADLPGNVQPSTPTSDDEALSLGENYADGDFGFVGQGSLGDRVWLDMDGDGAQEAGEPGIVGATVTLRWAGQNALLGDADDVVYTTTTGANGVYTFPNLALGDYRASVVPGSLPAGLSATYDLNGATDGVALADLTSSAPTRNDVDFGYQGGGSIGDRVWFDTDGDGAQDAGEGGLNGITVTLTWFGPDNTPGNGDDAALLTTTDASGSYNFGGLPSGSYRVDVATGGLPGGVAATHDRDGDKNNSTTVVLGAGQTISDADFGYTGTGALGDRVWRDADLDGAQDTGEAGLSGVGVTLTWNGPDETFGTADDLTFNTTTGANGSYGFTRLPQGQYQVAVDTTTLPSGLNPTFDADGVASPSLATMPLAAGQTRADVDFGYAEGAPAATAALGDRVWRDTNGDGVQDADEPGIAGVTLLLTGAGPDGLFGTPDDQTGFAPQTTDATGNYSFTSLLGGLYRVRVDTTTLPAGLGQSYELDGTLNGATTVALGAGQTRLDVDWGYTPSNAGGASGTIGDRVWNDVDGDGVQDTNENGIAGVTLTLTGAGRDGIFDTADDTSASTTTDANGDYRFTALPPGFYRVMVDAGSLPKGVRPSYELDSSRNGSVTLELGLGKARSDVDWGYTSGNVPPATGSIGDRVWYDADADGVQDAGEAGLANVTVALIGAGADGVFGSADDLRFGQMTDTDGGYRFTGLPAGEYQVAIDARTLPQGSAPTFDRDGDKNGSTTLTLGANQTISDADWGYVGTGALGDRVWRDANANGQQDAGEPGFANITLTLTWPGADGLFGTPDDLARTTQTDASGNYAFDGLFAGQYRVTVDPTTLPNGLYETYELDGSMNGATTVPLAANQTRTDVDFGYTTGTVPTGAIGDHVWLDRNGDGVQDVGEGGLAGVTVVLIGAGDDGQLGTADDVVYSQQTSATGSYSFTGLVGGPYQVVVDAGSLPPGLQATADTHTGDTTTNGQTTLTLGNGQQVNDVNFGYQGTGSIGDRVWNDTNGNGTQDTGEEGLISTVEITWSGPDGVPGTGDDVTWRVLTGPDGSYEHDGLPTGTYVVTVDPTTLPPDMLPTGDADGDGDGQSDVGLSDGQNRDDVDFGFAVPAIDLALTKSDGGATPTPGGLLVYTLNYTNTGNYVTGGVVITEIVPAHTSFNAAASDAGWRCVGTAAGSTCTYTVGSLARAAIGSLAFAVTIDRPLPAGVDGIRNSALIGDDGGHGAETQPSDNAAVLPTRVEAAPDLQLRKSDGGGVLKAGGWLTYTLTYTNAGQQGATSVVISETVPAYTSFDAARSTPGWSCAATGAGSNCTFAVGELGAGQSGALRFVVRIDDPLPGDLTGISNVATIADDGRNGDDPTNTGDPIDNNVDGVNTTTQPTAISLLGFRAVRAEGGVSVRWATGLELNTWGFHLLRSADEQRVNARRVTDALVLAQGRDGGGATYQWLDTNAEEDATYSYWLQEVELDGTIHEYGPVRVSKRNGGGGTEVYLPLIGR